VEIASTGIVERPKSRCYNGIMQKDSRSLTHLTDAQLLLAVTALAGHEREATAQLIASLAELDARRLYLGEGFSSLFTYCTQCLHLSEHAAYRRIEAARATRKWPVILDLLADGSITLTTVCLLASHLTPENHLAALAAATHRSKRQVEQQVAALRPLPPVPSSVRKLPAPKPALSPLAAGAEMGVHLPPPPQASITSDMVRRAPEPPRSPAVVTPLAPERYKVQLTISRDTHDKLRRVQDLLRHSIPDGDPAAIFDRALTLLLADLEKKKLAQTHRPRPAGQSTPRSRHVPAAVRREVWQRDGGQCAFTGARGRCAERGFLEFHHVVPFADGGETTSANLQLRCRAHNTYEAAARLGPMFARENRALYELGPDRGCEKTVAPLPRNGSRCRSPAGTDGDSSRSAGPSPPR
jgi:5-methylcytosine-specific restriction endonuclease McrA